ncbi:multidrug efflux SMR transporter [Hasllibacter sp. MH4015]|uniref:DMT family transporter n=1 Tax=Hasllibacter sp. MH4015 TaxID=2854029 RepID=UPI001CD3234A|nr:multidrug efflux SMR transporter [Hasllibacter sp. MH4015]
MGWLFLIIAGLLETAWAGLLKSMAGEWSLGRGAGFAAALVGSMWCLGLALKHLPISIAYPIWTGIGSVGAVVLGATLFGETASWRVLAGVSLLIAGMALLASDSV